MLSYCCLPHSSRKIRGSFAAAEKRLLLSERHAVGALVNSGVLLMSAHKDPIQRTVVLIIAVVGTLMDSAFNAHVGVIIHINYPPFTWFCISISEAMKTILEKLSIVAF